MCVGSGLHAGEIECLVSRFVENVRWLGVFARDELPDLTREIRPWCLILNTHSKDQPGTHWLALYAPSASSIELFDSFGFSPSMYSLDFLEALHSSYSLQHLALLYVVSTVLFISIFVVIIIHFMTLLICLLMSQIVTNGTNSIFTICKFVFAFLIHVTVLVNVANYNVNFVKPIKMYKK